MDVLASTPSDHEEWVVGEITGARVRLHQSATGERMQLRRSETPPDLKPGDVIRIRARPGA